METQQRAVTPIAMSDADRVRVGILALMSLTAVVGAAISPDLLGRAAFVLAAIVFGAAALWTPWQRRRGIAPAPPAAPTTDARRAGNATIAAFFGLAILVAITVEHPDLILFAIAVMALPVASAIEKVWPKARER